MYNVCLIAKPAYDPTCKAFKKTVDLKYLVAAVNASLPSTSPASSHMYRVRTKEMTLTLEALKSALSKLPSFGGFGGNEVERAFGSSVSGFSLWLVFFGGFVLLVLFFILVPKPRMANEGHVEETRQRDEHSLEARETGQ